jgi:hypothetical protein
MVLPTRVPGITVEGKSQVHLVPDTQHDRQSNYRKCYDRKHAHHISLQRDFKKVHHNKVDNPRHKTAHTDNGSQHSDKLRFPVHYLAVDENHEKSKGCEKSREEKDAA